MQHFLGMPDENNSFYDETLRYELDERLCFIYGSNARGIHGAGAAKQAVTEYGAIYGQGKGFAGRSYGIPTKDEHIITLPLVRVASHIRDFIEWSQEQVGMGFYITPIGTGLAGFPHERIAPLFEGVMNAWLPECWRPYLEK